MSLLKTMSWEDLWNHFWEMKEEYSSRKGNYRVPRERDVTLSQEEFDTLLERAVEEGLVFKPMNTRFGFNVGLHILKPREETFPGAAHEAESVLFLDPCHFPGYDFHKNRYGFSEIWEVIDPIVNSEDNLQRLDAAGMDRPRDAVHYMY